MVNLWLVGAEAPWFMLQNKEGRDQEGGEHDIEPVCFDVFHDVFLCFALHYCLA
jgi:hypothetical protein